MYECERIEFWELNGHNGSIFDDLAVDAILYGWRFDVMWKSSGIVDVFIGLGSCFWFFKFIVWGNIEKCVTRWFFFMDEMNLCTVGFEFVGFKKIVFNFDFSTKILYSW